jgi:hypothetical protein
MVEFLSGFIKVILLLTIPARKPAKYISLMRSGASGC